jgi:hypothetical protein
MTRRSLAGGVIVPVLAATTLAATALAVSAPAGATRAGQLCPAFASLGL